MKNRETSEGSRLRTRISSLAMFQYIVSAWRIFRGCFRVCCIRKFNLVISSFPDKKFYHV